MKTIICLTLVMFISLAFASAIPAPDSDASLDSSDINPAPAAEIEGEQLQPEESHWGYGGYGRGYGGWGGGYGGWHGGYGGWGGHGGWWGRGHGGWGGRGHGWYGGGWGWGR